MKSLVQEHPLLAGHPLFQCIAVEDMPGLLRWLGAARHQYPAGAYILRAGEDAALAGIILTGRIQVVADDIGGNRRINAVLEAGGLFGESLALAGVSELPVSVLAVEESEVLLLQLDRLLEAGTKTAPPPGAALLANLLRITAEKNVYLNNRLAVLAARSTRGKLLAYLSGEAARQGSRRFTIPFDRQGLADFLCVERSAMSAELSRMAAEGLLRTHRSRFELLV